MDVFSDWSDAQSATPEAQPAAPSRPSLPLAECGDAQIQLDWNDVTGADSYQLYRSTSSSTPGSDPSGLINRSSSSYTDMDVANGTTYYYWARARGAGGNGAWSNRVSCRPMAVPPPAAPSLAVDLCGNARIELDWNSITGDTSYQLYRSTSSSTPGSNPSGLIPVSGSRYTDNERGERHHTYYYWVRARGAVGDGAWKQPRFVSSGSPSTSANRTTITVHARPYPYGFDRHSDCLPSGCDVERYHRSDTIRHRVGQVRGRTVAIVIRHRNRNKNNRAYLLSKSRWRFRVRARSAVETTDYDVRMNVERTPTFVLQIPTGLTLSARWDPEHF